MELEKTKEKLEQILQQRVNKLFKETLGDVDDLNLQRAIENPQEVFDEALKQSFGKEDSEKVLKAYGTVLSTVLMDKEFKQKFSEKPQKFLMGDMFVIEDRQKALEKVKEYLKEGDK